MNRRQRWMVQAVLAIVAGLLGWRLATEWKQADLRYEAFESPAESTPAVVPAAAPEERLAVEQIAANNLFSADRNNALPEPETAETGPAPPKPTVLGTMKLGENYEALMSPGDTAEGGVRRVKQGEQVGGYRVVEIRDSKVVIEYEGSTTTLDVYQSRKSVSQQRTHTTTAARPAVSTAAGGRTPPARTPTAARAAAPSQPSTPDRGREIKPPGLAPYTRVFIEGNRRRVERTTPFGIQKWYEPLQPGDTQ